MVGKLRRREVHGREEQQPKKRAEPPRGGHVLGRELGELHDGGADADLGEDFHDAHHNQRQGHHPEVFRREDAREDADVDELQDHLQQDVEALPAQRSPPRGRAALRGHQRAMLTARRSRITVILT